MARQASRYWIEELRRDCDVLVVGSGASGLSAAVTSAWHGLEVIVAEKEAAFGGTTAWSGGWIWAPLNPLARRAGTGLAVLDIEFVKIAPEIEIAALEPFLAAGAELGAKYVITSLMTRTFRALPIDSAP